MALGEIIRTDRGFQLIRFRDHNGSNSTLQQSSLAIYEQPGTSAVWLGIEGERMHLNLEQVKDLIEALQNWVDEGTFDKEEAGDVEKQTS